MKGTTTLQAGAPAGKQAHDEKATRPARCRMSIETNNRFAAEKALPCQADRQKIVDRANLLLADARAVAVQSDHSWHWMNGPYGGINTTVWPSFSPGTIHVVFLNGLKHRGDTPR